MTNNAYKCWHPADEKVDSANSSRVTRGEHPSWLARLRFSLFPPLVGEIGAIVEVP